MGDAPWKSAGNTPATLGPSGAVFLTAPCAANFATKQVCGEKRLFTKKRVGPRPVKYHRWEDRRNSVPRTDVPLTPPLPFANIPAVAGFPLPEDVSVSLRVAEVRVSRKPTEAEASRRVPCGHVWPSTFGYAQMSGEIRLERFGASKIGSTGH